MINESSAANAGLPGGKCPVGFVCRYWHYIFILIYTVIFHYPLILPGIGMPPWGDFYSYYTPLRIFAALRLHEGDMPFLADGLFAGYQAYSDPPLAFFYPVNFIFSLLVANPSSEAAMDYYILSNLLILSVSSLYLARSLRLSRAAAVMAAVIMSMNGFNQMHITHIGILQVMSCTYFAGALLAKFAWGGGRDWRLALWAGFFLGMGNLVGHPQTTMFGDYALGMCMLVATGIYWQRTRDNRAPVRILGWSLVAVILSVLLAAVALLPTGYLLSVSYKMGMTREIAMGEAVVPRHLPSMLFPGFYWALPWNMTWPFYTRMWPHWMCANPLEGLTFLGVAGFGLGLAGFIANIRKWPAHLLFWGALLMVAASLGPKTPVYGWMYDYMPMVDLVRVPSRVLWLFYTAWALLAGLGLESCLRGSVRYRPRAFMVAAGIMLAALLAMVAGLFIVYDGNWLDTWIWALVPFRDEFEPIVRSNVDYFFDAITEQIIVGGLLAAATFAWLVYAWRRGGRAWLCAGMIFLVAFELFLYGFGRSYEINIPTYKNAHSDAMQAIPGQPTGRVVIPHFVHGSDGINVAAYNGISLAGGYSPSIAKWVYHTLPGDVPPWRVETDGRLMESKLFDAWNVSDIVLRRKHALAEYKGRDVPIEDWGFAMLISPGEQLTSATTQATSAPVVLPDPAGYRVAVDTDTSAPIQKVFVMAASLGTIDKTDGTHVGTMLAVPEDDSQTTMSFPFTLGENTSDISYNLEHIIGDVVPRHTQLPVAFARDAVWEWTDEFQFYVAEFKLPATVPLKELVFVADGTNPTGLAVSQAYLLDEHDNFSLVFPIEQYGFEEVDIDNDKYRVLRRPEPTGDTWVVPTATRGSHKQIEYVLNRLSKREFDVTRDVIVDKHDFEEDDMPGLNAPQPEDFRATATLERIKPEHVVVKSDSNQRGWLVVSVAWDGGWKAWLDGKPVELHRGNGPFIAVPVTAGQHTLEMRYRPVNFVLGAIISSLTLLGILMAPWLARSWKRRKQRREASHFVELKTTNAGHHPGE